MSGRWSFAAAPFFALGLGMLVVLALWVTRDYAVPIAIAVLIWFLITALAESMRRGFAPLLNLPPMLARILATAIFLAVGFVAANLLSNGISELAIDAAGRQGALMARIEELALKIGVDLVLDPGQIIATIEPQRWLGTVLGIAQGVISDVSLVMLYVLFLLIDERFYGAKMRALFPDPERRAEAQATLRSLGETTRIYLWLMTLVSAGVGLITYAVCAALGLPGAGFWGVLAFALNYVPTIGSILAVALPSAYGLAVLEDPATLLLLIGLLGATQFVAGEIVVPRIMGNRLNLSSFVILLTLVLWGAIWGPAGMFLAIPITVILVMIAARFEATRPIAILLSKDGNVPVPRNSRPAPANPAELAAKAPEDDRAA